MHAVCAEKGKLYELAQAVLGDMPEKSIEKVEETYGFVYRNGRDLSGFIDGKRCSVLAFFPICYAPSTKGS